MVQVRPAPGNGGSTSWEIHRCYPNLELSCYLIWTISSKLGSWSSWQKTLFHKIGSNVDVNFAWSRPCLINFWTSCLIIGLVTCLHFNQCFLFGLTISLLLHSWGWQRVVPRRSPQIFEYDCEVIDTKWQLECRFDDHLEMWVLGEHYIKERNFLDDSSWYFPCKVI